MATAAKPHLGTALAEKVSALTSRSAIATREKHPAQPLFIAIISF